MVSGTAFSREVLALLASWIHHDSEIRGIIAVTSVFRPSSFRFVRARGSMSKGVGFGSCGRAGADMVGWACKRQRSKRQQFTAVRSCANDYKNNCKSCTRFGWEMRLADVFVRGGVRAVRRQSAAATVRHGPPNGPPPPPPKYSWRRWRRRTMADRGGLDSPLQASTEGYTSHILTTRHSSSSLLVPKCNNSSICRLRH